MALVKLNCGERLTESFERVPYDIFVNPDQVSEIVPYVGHDGWSRIVLKTKHDYVVAGNPDEIVAKLKTKEG